MSSLPNSFTGALDQIAANLLVTNISRQEQTLDAFLFHQSLRLLRVPLLLKIIDGNVSAFFGKQESRRPGQSRYPRQ